MDHISVDSKQIASIAFDAPTNRMQVLFRRGGLYEYTDVTAEEFESVLSPAAVHNHSVGTAFGQLIKGVKPFTRLESSTGAAPVIEMPKKPLADPAANPVPLPEEAIEVSRKSESLATQALGLRVSSIVTQTEASEVLKTIAAMRREISETFAPMKEAAFRAHRTVCDQEKKVDGPLAEAELFLKGQIGSYDLEQRRLAAEEDERRRKEERERAEREDRERHEQETLRQALELEAQGQTEAAAAVLDAPAPIRSSYVAPAPVAPAVAQVKGVTTRYEWDFRILDAAAVPREYMLVNEAAIRQVVKATKGRVKIAGIEAYEKPVVSSSRRG